MNTYLSAIFKSICSSYNDHQFFAVDVGAHIGLFSKFLIETNLFNSVLAFEPHLENYLKILNEVSSKSNCVFEVINSALSSESGILNLHCDADTATASLLAYNSNYQHSGQLEKKSVSVFTLDDYLKTHTGPERLLFLKIDTQGNDLSVIKGSSHTISLHRPIIQTEFIYIPLYKNQCTPNELLKEFSSLNYEMYSLNNLHVTPEGRLAFCDAIFVPKELNIPVTQKYLCIDDQLSFKTQLENLNKICAERLTVIKVLDSEIQRLHKMYDKSIILNSVLKKVKSWIL